MFQLSYRLTRFLSTKKTFNDISIFFYLSCYWRNNYHAQSALGKSMIERLALTHTHTCTHMYFWFWNQKNLILLKLLQKINFEIGIFFWNWKWVSKRVEWHMFCVGGCCFLLAGWLCVLTYVCVVQWCFIIWYYIFLQQFLMFILFEGFFCSFSLYVLKNVSNVGLVY